MRDRRNGIGTIVTALAALLIASAQTPAAADTVIGRCSDTLETTPVHEPLDWWDPACASPTFVPDQSFDVRAAIQPDPGLTAVMEARLCRGGNLSMTQFVSGTPWHDCEPLLRQAFVDGVPVVTADAFNVTGRVEAATYPFCNQWNRNCYWLLADAVGASVDSFCVGTVPISFCLATTPSLDPGVGIGSYSATLTRVAG